LVTGYKGWLGNIVKEDTEKVRIGISQSQTAFLTLFRKN
jgi:hypothetical protein